MLIRRRSSAVLIAAAMMMVGVPGLHAQRPMRVDSGGGTASDSGLAAYLRSLHFIRDHVSSDERPLDWRVNHDIARVEPEATPYSDTATIGGGRIAVRIVNLGSAMVRRFGLLPRGITYIWVQDERGSRYAVYISADSTGRIVARTRVPMLPEYSVDSVPLFREPIARFRLSSPPSLRALTLCLGRCDSSGRWCGPLDSIRAITYVSPVKSGRP